MRKSLSVLLCITATTGLATARFGIDVSRSWSGKFTGQTRQKRRVGLVRKQAGDQISGTASPKRQAEPVTNLLRKTARKPSHLRPTTLRPVESS